LSYCPRWSLPAGVLAWLAARLAQLLDNVEVPSLLDRGFRGLTKTREHWHAPIGDRRTKDRLTDGQRAFNRLQPELADAARCKGGHCRKNCLTASATSRGPFWSGPK
jgi:hypothetical protein